MMERRSHSEKFNIRRNNDGNYHFQRNIEVNGILEQKHLNFKLHLRDACGAQALWIEPLGNCACEGRYDEMHQVIEQYFLDKGLNVKYWDDEKLQFTLEKK